MSSLLEKANAMARIGRSPGGSLPEGQLRERCELALAYTAGKVTAVQATHALGKRSKGNTAAALGASLLTAIRRGIVKCEIVAPK